VREVVYGMRFQGKAEPVGEAGAVLRAAACAPGGAPAGTGGPGGPTGTPAAAPGGEATFESEVTFAGETDFLATGTVRFGDGHALRVSTVGLGHLAPGADPGRRHGAVAWRVDGGEGRFAGATGLIASAFSVAEDLAVTDHHFGVLRLP
jgi:hypothetical protein